VLATQNPIELEGTFPLPEAQLDRFLISLKIGYPEKNEEDQILLRFGEQDPLAQLEAVTTAEEVIAMQEQRKSIRVEQTIRGYILDIARSTRENTEIELGASPRATLALYQTSQAWAALQGRDYVLPDDVKKMAPHVLTHRLILAPQAQLRGRDSAALLDDIIREIPVPVEA
jgi:MoxR-like ATPase